VCAGWDPQAFTGARDFGGIVLFGKEKTPGGGSGKYFDKVGRSPNTKEVPGGGAGVDLFKGWGPREGAKPP